MDVNARSKTNVLVVIDPGHGGKDPGAVGPSGLKEAVVNLAVASKLVLLLHGKGVDVDITRTKNVYVDLARRVNCANLARASWFVSIHCNSSANRLSRGVETYCWKRGGKAEKLARVVQQELVSATGLVNRGVKTRNFYVLRKTNMPAVLVELGFISNPEEEKLLADPDFQGKCAEAIAKAILKM